MKRVKKESQKMLKLAAIFLLLLIHPETVYADEVPYPMDAVITYKGEEVTHGEEEIYYLNDEVDITFKRHAPDITGEEDYFGERIVYASYYDGESFSDYEEIENDTIVLTPAEEDEYNRQVVIFKMLESYKIFNRNDESKTVIRLAENIYESTVYQFIFDKRAPVIKETEAITGSGKAAFVITDTSGLEKIDVIDNGETVDTIIFSKDKRTVEYEYEMRAGRNYLGDGTDSIKVCAEDLAGNRSEYTLNYAMDIERPVITADGIRDGEISPGDTKISLKVSDNSDEVFFYYMCEFTDSENRTVCLENHTESLNLKRQNDGNGLSAGKVTRHYSKEGIYDIVAFAYDGNGNYSEKIRLSFGIDRNAPEVMIENVNRGGIYRTSVNAYVTLKEMFFMNAEAETECTVTYDDITEKLKLSSYEIGAKSNRNIYTFSQDGAYRLKITAKDKYGRISADECEFVIDSTAPEIIIRNDMEVYGRLPDIIVDVKDSLSEYTLDYILAQKTEGSIYEELDRSKIVSVGKNVSIKVPVKSEGAYVLRIDAVDDAGNRSAKSYEFTVDETPPIIGFLSEINEKYVKEFRLPEGFDRYITDNSEFRYKTYLNSKEISSCSITKDGKYILQVVAEDEAGNISEERAAFIVDSTMPKIIVNGIGPEGTVKMNDTVNLSLFDDMDYFKEVSVNGEKYRMTDNRKISIPILEKGDYSITVTAADYAGNETVQTVKMSCSYSANPFEKTINLSDIKTLTKNDDEIRETFLFNFHNPVFLVISGLVVLAGAILGVFTFVDIKKLKCDTRKDAE